MIRLFIAEKPSLAQAIAEQLSHTAEKQKTHWILGNDIVTWCFGHILEQAMPENYNTQYATWRAEDLPIVPEQWKLLPKESCKAQLAAIKSLLTKADVVIHAGDPDREGQLLVDEVLLFLGNRKPVKRLLINDYNGTKVRQALAAIHNNHDAQFQGWYESALARSRFDWLFGINLSRAYTLAARKIHYEGVISIGRVQTPTLALVVERDLAIDNFKSKPFYTLKAKLKHEKGEFVARWKVKPEQPGLDEEGRLIDIAIAEHLAKGLINKPGHIYKYEKLTKNEQAPLLFSLSGLIKAANNKYGYSAQEVLDICQALYETHRLTTYPRTDCEYVSEAQHQEAPGVLAAIKANRPDLVQLASKADSNRKSPAFNDNKVTAHHAIVPTVRKASLSALTDKQLNIYDMVVRAYLAQFFPPHQYLQTTVEAQVENEIFSARGKTPVSPGWREIYSPVEDEDKKPEDNEQDNKQTIPLMKKGDSTHCLDCLVEHRKTTPPARFTEGTLQDAMKDIHKFVTHPEAEKRLREGQGIGTEATRPGIIEELKKRGFLQAEKAGSKKIISTSTARALILALPKHTKDPALTAICEQALEMVATQKLSAAEFIRRNVVLITKLCQEAATSSLGLPVAPQIPCPTCKSGYLKRRSSTNGHFWSCTNWNAEPTCSATFKDERGKPQLMPSPEISCPKCRTGKLRRFKGKKGVFWACSNYRSDANKCEATFPDTRGKPSFNSPTKKVKGRISK